MGLSEKELFEQFCERSGYVGDLHTLDGTQSLYSIESRNGKLYANDTFALRQAYEATFFKGPDELFYRSEQHYEESQKGAA